MRESNENTETSGAKYRFGFILSTSLGNITRYNNFRKFAERDSEIEFVWAPVKHYFTPQELNPFRLLPKIVQNRAIVLYQALPVLRRLRSLDAVMLHLYEADILLALRGYMFSAPLRIISSDDAPAVDPSRYPFHPVELTKPAWRRALRLKIDIWRARRSDMLIPFSKWATDILVKGVGIDASRVTPIHVGLDLDIWRYTPKIVRNTDRPIKILFVGGEFFRKGGADLLKAVAGRLATATELHIVTKTVLQSIPGNARVYNNLSANDDRLARLYRDSDILVHPTTSDLSSWVILEAMASGCAVITTPVGGIVDLIDEGYNGLLVPVGNPTALAGAIDKLVGNPLLRMQMGANGRAMIEEHYDAKKNVPLILRALKNAVDQKTKARQRKALR